nr:MAG TPA: tail assembly chaperone protein [Caudoviricetes sp.]
MLYAWGAWLIFFCLRVENGLYIETRHRKDTLMNLSPAAAQAALDYAEELAATGLSSEQYDHYYL